MSNFLKVAGMNDAFGNPQGNPNNINWSKVRNQCKNILDEFAELMVALGADSTRIDEAKRNFLSNINFTGEPDRNDVRDALCDIHVFAYGAHHFMGINADKDMDSVVEAVMSRFIKDKKDMEETTKKHAAKGVNAVYFEGDYPTMIMKSMFDQPDAPKGKFLKSASCKDPVFYEPKTQVGNGATPSATPGAFDPL